MASSKPTKSSTSAALAGLAALRPPRASSPAPAPTVAATLAASNRTKVADPLDKEGSDYTFTMRVPEAEKDRYKECRAFLAVNGRRGSLGLAVRAAFLRLQFDDQFLADYDRLEALQKPSGPKPSHR
jgi:hypothetical protein